ncbi:MAG TPA: cytochrome c3 family protein [Chitinophagales bacterium]|nr:cytochrome c3 family protein [Chitinophagales bacterium]
MYSCKPIRKILALIVITLFLSLSATSFAAVAVPDVAATDAAGVERAKAGMALFKANCTSCHAIDRKVVGPALTGVWDRWESEAKIVAWVQNSSKLIASGDAYSNKIFNEYNKSVMSAFPQLTAEQIMDILIYVKNPSVAEPAKAATATDAGATAGGAENKGASAWYIWALVAFLVVLALLLWTVTSKLDKAVREKAGEVVEDIPLAKKVFSNKTFKVLMLIGSILLVFNIFGGAIDLGRSQGYAPDQPIKFSHALHVGQNKIECQYCHTGVEKSKHASIPGTQICMNCHKYVQQGPKYGKDEIAKIYDYAGWDVDKQKFTQAPKNIEWVKIHNLPDHVYFNHSQHVKVGGVKCQTCHGKVEEYEVMKQFAPLSMGWCINCHRQTEVKFAENKYYSVFQKYQDELKKGTKSKVTVEDIGGTECQKCHY